MEAVPDTEPALDPGEDEAKERVSESVSRRTFGGELMRSMGLGVFKEGLEEGEIKADGLVDALVKIEAYGADFFELETLEDLVSLWLGDFEVGDLDLDLDLELMREGLENKL